MSDTPRQNTPAPVEIRISMRAFINLLIAYYLAYFVTNSITDETGEFSHASAAMALTIVFGECYLRFLSLRGEEVAMPLWFIVIMVSLGVIFVFNARAVISFTLGTF